MRYVEAPNIYEPQPGELSIFLAGGIIGCPDWQTEMVDRLSDTKLAVVNPRRKVFPNQEHDQYVTTHQIKWEFDHLRKANCILFWFPKEGLCQTSLYEIGCHAASDVRMFVGIEYGYVKRGGLTKQLALIRPDMPVVSNLEDLELMIKGSI
jgi:hypothetical protein